MIDMTIHEEPLQRAVEMARQQHILIPTFEEQKYPDTIDPRITKKLQELGLWDVNSFNLFRVTWKNEPVKQGGLYGNVPCFYKRRLPYRIDRA